jgi:hypothetical protein
MSLSKQLPSKLSRGAHLSFTESKAVALEIGTLIETAERDVENRIKLNPIVERVEKLLGAPCKLGHFVEYNEILLRKLCSYMQLERNEIYITRSGRHKSGTW